MSITEASEFWDEHSLLEFEGTEQVEVEFKLKKKRYIGLAQEAFKRKENISINPVGGIIKPKSMKLCANIFSSRMKS